MSGLDVTHDPKRKSWVAGADAAESDFPLQNLPLGRLEGGRPCTAIGDRVLDLAALARAVTLPAGAQAAVTAALSAPGLAALGPVDRVALRHALSDLLGSEAAPSIRARIEPLLVPMADCRLALPVEIRNYTDFYSSLHHATNVGALFRPDNPLLPNYKHVPIGYHGRASTLVPSGTQVRRPKGQTKPPDAEAPLFGPCRRLDYECELGIVIGHGNRMGEPIPVDEAEAHILGFCLVNDWSARDVQAWEYQPLGPFLAKSFATTVSPWLITPEALAPFRIDPPSRPPGDPAPLPYLQAAAPRTLAIETRVALSTEAMRAKGLPAQVLSRTRFAEAMYWTPAQLVAHHASNGCALAPGDLLATGTLSNAEPESWGSLLELSRGGKQPVALDSGESRTFLQDGDEVVMSARCTASGRAPIGFGLCTGRILPA